MVSFRPLSRSLPLASRAALLSTSSSCCAPSLAFRHAPRRAAALASSKFSSSNSPGFLPSSIRALTTARDKVKVLLVLYDGGKHAQDVSCSSFHLKSSKTRPGETNCNPAFPNGTKICSSPLNKTKQPAEVLGNGKLPKLPQATHWLRIRPQNCP